MDIDTSWRRRFAWLWLAYAISTAGTFIAFDAFPLMAILVLHASPAQVSVLAAMGLAVGAVVAVPIAPLLERRRKRPAMIAADLIRFAAFASVPIAFGFGWLGFTQLLVVSVMTGAADIAFRAASGTYLKTLLPRGELLTANARFEQTLWTATILGPPLGGAAFALFGPVITVIANAASFLLSAIAIRAIGGQELSPAQTGTPRLHAADVFEGWRYILAHPTLRPLFFNTIMVNGLIMATAPLPC
jgi:MFS family permease